MTANKTRASARLRKWRPAEGHRYPGRCSQTRLPWATIGHPFGVLYSAASPDGSGLKIFEDDSIISLRLFPPGEEPEQIAQAVEEDDGLGIF